MIDAAISVLSLLEKAITISGRKKLQKVCFLLKHVGYDFPFKYAYHHYGPYSAVLQNELDYLTGNGYVVDIGDEHGYVYQVTEKGQKFNENLLVLEGLDEFKLDDNLLNTLIQQSPSFLEEVSTYAFLLENGYNKADAINKLKELKPHLMDQADKAVKFYNQVFAPYFS